MVSQRQLTKFNKKGEVNRVCKGVLGGALSMQHRVLLHRYIFGA